MGRPWSFKTDAEPFEAVWRGCKTAELRNLSDRPEIEVDDWLMLWEIKDGLYTGRTIEAQISHIQTGYGLPEGFAMLSLCCLIKAQTSRTGFKTQEEVEQQVHYVCNPTK